MVIGQSRYFDLQTSGSIATITATWKLIRNDTGVVTKNAVCPKDGNSHQIRIQTDDLTAGFYTLRVDTVDSADGFKDTIYNEKIEFIK